MRNEGSEGLVTKGLPAVPCTSTHAWPGSPQPVSRGGAPNVSADVTTSTLIQGARYWPEDRALELCFAGGRRYLYLGVPRRLAEEFQEADSKGTFFNRSIKGRFTCHELVSQGAERTRRAAND